MSLLRWIFRGLIQVLHFQQTCRKPLDLKTSLPLSNLGKAYHRPPKLIKRHVQKGTRL